MEVSKIDEKNAPYLQKILEAIAESRAAAPPAMPKEGKLFKEMWKIIPHGEYGKARIDSKILSQAEMEASNLVGRLNGSLWHRYMEEPRHITRLLVGGNVMMTDADFERRTNAEVLRRAHGDVLIAGLGIGFVLLPMLEKPEVGRISVVELDVDVMRLVLDPLRRHLTEEQNSRLDIFHQDIFEFETDEKYDIIYFDIWPSVDPGNLSQIATLKERFASNLREGPRSWIGAWVEDECVRRSETFQFYACDHGVDLSEDDYEEGT